MNTIVPYHEYTNYRLINSGTLIKFAKSQRLVISEQDEIGANVLALDEVKRKLVFANPTPGKSTWLIVDLHHLEFCTIKKEYTSIHAGILQTKKLHQFLKTIFLNLVFKYGSGTLSLPLFDTRREKQNNIERVESKAKKWSSLISKLLPGAKIITPETIPNNSLLAF